MTVALPADRRRARRATIGLVVVGLLLLFGAANIHLVYVAVTSQPDCVAHLRPGDAGGQGAYQAAKSACSPGARP